MIELPVAWILATIGTLAGAIATLAKLQDDVERLSKGCGHSESLWKGR